MSEVDDLRARVKALEKGLEGLIECFPPRFASCLGERLFSAESILKSKGNARCSRCHLPLYGLPEALGMHTDCARAGIRDGSVVRSDRPLIRP
jgi:hypothetical protein